MINIKTIIIILLIFFLFVPSGCDFKVKPANSFVRSGTVQEDDVEEPLSDDEKQYEKALTTSNEIIDAFINDNLSDFYNKYTSVILQNKIHEDDFSKIYASVIEKTGPINSYKKMQWWFEQGEDHGTKIIISKKIVHHEKQVLFYNIVFKHGEYDQIIGIHFQIRKKIA